MSFSTDLKSELSEIMPSAVHCRLAFLAGVVVSAGKLEGGELNIRLENESLQKVLQRIIRKTFDNTDEMMYTSNSGGQKKMIITGTLVDDFFSTLKLSDVSGSLYTNNIVIEKTCCKRAFIRGAFLTVGSVSSPEKSYHFEMVYIKDGDEIASLLSVMGAVNSLMTFENVRIVKDIRNSINREVNCETANISKVASASVKQIKDIEYIDSEMGRDYLPDSLRELADVRIANPLLSLKELGDMLQPPIGKSGVNHRLRRISALADKLRESR